MVIWLKQKKYFFMTFSTFPTFQRVSILRSNSCPYLPESILPAGSSGEEWVASFSVNPLRALSWSLRFSAGERGCLFGVYNPAHTQKQPDMLLLFRRRYFALSGAAASPRRVTGCLARRNPSFKCGRPAGWGECIFKKKIELAAGDSPARVEGTVCGGWMEVKHFYPRFAVPSDSALLPLIGQRPGRSGGRGSSVIGRRQLPFLSGLTSRGHRVVSQAPCKLRTEVSRQVHNFFFKILLMAAII